MEILTEMNDEDKIKFMEKFIIEVKEAYRFSLCNNGPTAIILSRHNFDLYEKK